MENNQIIKGGVYLVLNPAMDSQLLLTKLEAALIGGVQVVQIWNNWTDTIDKFELIEAIANVCKPYQVPLLINEEWELLMESSYLNGVHFDNIPADFPLIKKTIARPFLAGITCSNSIENAIWADQQQLDYISFCSMFPSPSAASCDIVMPATVKQVRAKTKLPIFVAGGITPENILSLKNEIEFDGVAVISGILSDNNPEQKVKQYKDALGI